MERRLEDRTEAGRLLADKLAAYANRSDVLVLALPRGGVPVGFEIARALNAPLDVFLVRKLGVPGQEELAMGAIARGGARLLNRDAIENLAITEDEIRAVEAREREELERRERAYRGGRPAPEVEGRTVILVDDGIATGSTMRVAIKALRKLRAARIVIAVAVGPLSTIEELKREADEVVAVLTPEMLYAISPWYEHFPQVTDLEVYDLLEMADPRRSLMIVNER
ncbi:MAG: phosphoribosyltransferase family protein [Acidobacteriota bacterium]